MTLDTVSPHLQNGSSAGTDWLKLKEEGPLRGDRLLRAKEVQHELGVSRATAYRMMTDGTLPTYRFGGRNGRRAMVRVSQTELRAWIAAHRATSSVAVQAATC